MGWKWEGLRAGASRAVWNWSFSNTEVSSPVLHPSLALCGCASLNSKKKTWIQPPILTLDTLPKSFQTISLWKQRFFSFLFCVNHLISPSSFLLCFVTLSKPPGTLKSSSCPTQPHVMWNLKNLWLVSSYLFLRYIFSFTALAGNPHRYQLEDSAGGDIQDGLSHSFGQLT